MASRRSDDEYSESAKQGRRDGRANIPNIDTYKAALAKDENAKLTTPYADRLWHRAQMQGAQLGEQFEAEVRDLRAERARFLATEKQRDAKLRELLAAAGSIGSPGSAPTSIPQALQNEIDKVTLARDEAHQYRIIRQSLIESSRKRWTQRARAAWHATHAELSVYWAAVAEEFRNFGAAISAAPKLEPDLPDWTKPEYPDEVE